MVERFRGTAAYGVVALASVMAALDGQCVAQTKPGVSSSLVSASDSSAAAGLGSAAGSGKAARVVVPNRDQQHVDLYEGPVRPFSSVAVGGEFGTLGIGADLATPLSRRFNLRGGVQFVNFGYDFVVDQAQYRSEAHLRSGHVGVDVHPMGGGFRLSPQLLLFQSAFSASVTVEGGTAFQLGNANYLSSPTDPVHGSASITMGRHMMPALTIGWGNMVARRSRHWTLPFELGVAYTGHYTMALNLAGTACQNAINCFSTSSPQVQQSVREEESQLNETMKHFQVYPIMKTGFAYRF